MTLTDVGRKRPRSCDEEGCELMPISKRINNLHIRSSNTSAENSNSSDIGQSDHCMQLCQVPSSSGSSSFDMVQCNAMDSKDSGGSVADDDFSNSLPCQYAPELSNAENPHYYYINSVLFEAHMQRLLRLSKNGVVSSHCN